MSRNEALEKKAPALIDYQSVCGIDALYFYIKVDFNHYSRFYINNLLKNHLESENFVLTSKDYSSQFTYFNHFGEIKRKDEKAAAKAFSLTILHNLSKQYPEIKQELKTIIDDRWEYESAAFRARARKILKEL